MRYIYTQRYIYAYEVYLHLQGKSTTTGYIYIHLRYSATPSWKSLQMRPQTVQKYDASTNISDVLVKYILTPYNRIQFPSSIEVKSRIRIRIKMALIRNTGL
jgi:hypothetical protein